MKTVVRDCAITACQENHLNCVVAGVSWKAAIAKKNLLVLCVLFVVYLFTDAVCSLEYMVVISDNKIKRIWKEGVRS
jgi:hypothetical protein